MKRIYLDYAAATPVKKEVKKAMDRFWDIDFGNAGALHQEGVTAKKALSQARQLIAQCLNASSTELIFNSGGTEANSLAIFGVINQLRDQGLKLTEMHLITTVFEHPSVLQCFKLLEKQGVSVDYLNINSEGFIDLDQLKKALNPKTVLISIMFVNNEIGTIQPLMEVVKIIKNFKKEQKGSSAFPVLHSDAAQALLFLPLDTKKLSIDLLSFDAQKIYGPKGVGALYIKKGINLNPLIIGGSQEGGLRPGTENVPLIVGFATALKSAQQEQGKEGMRLAKLRDFFIKEILEKIPEAVLNGSLENRLPNNINFSFPNKNSEFLVIQLDRQGIACSTKSACLKGGSSYVIHSLSGDENRSRNSLRFTLGRLTTKKDLQFVIKKIVEICS